MLSQRKCPQPTSAMRNAGMSESRLFSTPSLKHPRRESKALASSLHFLVPSASQVASNLAQAG